MGETVPAKGSILGKCVPARYILAVLGSIGMAIVYGLKVNLSVAMVAMLNHTAIKELGGGHGHGGHDGDDSLFSNLTISIDTSGRSEVCQPPSGAGEGSHKAADGPFIWSEPLQGTLLSCYFWGYLVSQIPGARVAELFSAKWVMFFSVAINVVCTLLTPPLTKLGYVGLIFMRVLEGIGGGVTFPAMHCMLATWAPPTERSVMSTIVYIGTAFGTAKSILLAGVLASSCGWESVFYVMGGLSSLWMILWAFLVQDHPNQQRLMSQEERDYILAGLGTGEGGHEEKRLPVPWKKVFTSLPFLAILVAHTCSNWGWYMFLIEIPFYMKQVLKFEVSSNALASALPYYPMFLFSVCLGKSLDFLRSKDKITTTTARKTATFIASLVPAICLLILCHIGCRHTAAVVIMAIGIIGIGGMFCGFLSNHIDIAPKFAGTLVALTNTVATLPGIIVPLFVGFMTKGNQTIEAWRVIFYVTVVLFSIELIVFTIFGSGEEQPWNKAEPSFDSIEAQSWNETKKDDKSKGESSPLKGDTSPK